MLKRRFSNVLTLRRMRFVWQPTCLTRARRRVHIPGLRGMSEQTRRRIFSQMPFLHCGPCSNNTRLRSLGQPLNYQDSSLPDPPVDRQAPCGYNIILRLGNNLQRRRRCSKDNRPGLLAACSRLHPQPQWHRDQARLSGHPRSLHPVPPVAHRLDDK